MQELKIQAGTLDPLSLSVSSTHILSTTLTRLVIVDGTLNAGTATLHLLRACKSSIKQCSLSGTPRWVDLLLEELCQTEYHLRRLVIFAPPDDTVTYRQHSLEIYYSLSRLFASHPKLQSVGIGRLDGLGNLCGPNPATFLQHATFFQFLPPALQDLALGCSLPCNPTATMDFISSGRCPMLRRLYFTEMKSRRLPMICEEKGIRLPDVGKDAEDLVWKPSLTFCVLQSNSVATPSPSPTLPPSFSSDIVSRIPLEVLAMILSPNHLTSLQSRGIPLVCHKWYALGMQLLWRDVDVELGSFRLCGAYDAILDQARHRNSSLKSVRIMLDNTALLAPLRDDRRQQALDECTYLLERLPRLDSFSLSTDPESTSDLWHLLGLILDHRPRLPCSGFTHLHLCSEGTQSTPSTIPLMRQLELLSGAHALRELLIEVDTLNPLSGPILQTPIFAASLTTLKLVDGRLNFATATIHLIRGCKSSLRRCSLEGEPRWLEVVLKELCEAGYDLRRLIIFAQRDYYPPVTASTMTAFIHRLLEVYRCLSCLFTVNPNIQSVGIVQSHISSIIFDQGAYFDSWTTIPDFLQTLPTGLQDLALDCSISQNGPDIMHFLSSGRCPQLRSLHFRETHSQRLSIVCKEMGIKLRTFGSVKGL
ncbi:hypothetical protein P7C70_g5267, partial [Phenoliferia sp. Uapishka_3]